MMELNQFLVLSADGPLSDPSMVRPTGPSQMVNRMQNPAGLCIRFLVSVLNVTF